MPRVVWASLLLLPNVAVAASPWTQSCEDRGRETWGTIVDVVDHGQADQVDERFNHVAVHRPLENQRLGRAVRATRSAEPGLVLCYGDWVETWRNADVTLAEVGSRALLTVRGGSLVWLDAQLRHVQGIVDYYVLDAPDEGDRETPVPVALGYSAVTASRQDSTFRVEVLDPASGEALITVSPDNDVFLGGSAARDHGVTIDGSLRVKGGQTARIREGRALSASDDDRREADEALAQAKAELDALASSLWDAPTNDAWRPAGSHRTRIVLQGLAYPDRLEIDGTLLPPTSWRRVHWKGGGAGLVSVGRIPIEDGLHEVVVETWGERSEVQLKTDGTSAAAATIRVPREHWPRRAAFQARPRLVDPYIRAERLELNPSVRYGSFGSYASRSSFETTGIPTASVKLDGPLAVARLPVRALLHGGRFWVELVGVAGVFAPNEIEVELDFDTFPGVAVPPPLPWYGFEAFAGASGGHRLSWDLGFGVVGVPKLRIEPGSVTASSKGLLVLPVPLVRLAWGTNWKVAVDFRGGGLLCPVKGTNRFISCPRGVADGGLSLERDLGRVSPWLRGGISYQQSRVWGDQGEDPEDAVFETFGALGLEAEVGIRWRVGRGASR